MYILTSFSNSAWSFFFWFDAAELGGGEFEIAIKSKTFVGDKEVIPPPPVPSFLFMGAT